MCKVPSFDLRIDALCLIVEGNDKLENNKAVWKIPSIPDCKVREYFFFFFGFWTVPRISLFFLLTVCLENTV